MNICLLLFGCIVVSKAQKDFFSTRGRGHLIIQQRPSHQHRNEERLGVSPQRPTTPKGRTATVPQFRTQTSRHQPIRLKQAVQNQQQDYLSIFHAAQSYRQQTSSTLQSLGQKTSATVQSNRQLTSVQSDRQLTSVQSNRQLTSVQSNRQLPSATVQSNRQQTSSAVHSDVQQAVASVQVDYEAAFKGQPILDGKCPELEGVQVYPHPDSCNHFYKCANGSLSLETCANGLLFNHQTADAGGVFNHCSYNWQTNCNGRANDSTPFSSPGCDYQFGIFPVAEGCYSSYTKCAHGLSEEIPCPLGLAYDSRLHNCNYPDLLIKSAGCDPEAAFGFRCPLEFELTALERRFWPFPRFAFPSDPQLYVLCVNDLPRLKSCGRDHVFSQSELTCKWNPPQ